MSVVRNLIPDDGSLWSIRANDISGNHSQKLIFDTSGNAVIQTGNTSRLTIHSTGLWSCDGGMSYNNTTNTLTAGTFSGNVSGSSITTIVNLIYPIGIIISTSTATNPSVYISGTTWVAYGQGQTLVGKASSGTFSTAGATGGAESVTLTQNNLPLHSHNNTLSDPGHSHILRMAGSLGGNRVINGDYFGPGPGQSFFTPSGWQIITETNGSSPAYAQSTTTGISITNGNNTTTNTAVNILQPYVVVYYWTRTL